MRYMRRWLEDENTVILAYALHGHNEKALDMYYEMCGVNIRMDLF